MKSKSRRDAREAAMQALFQLDQNARWSIEDARDFLHERLDFPRLEAFAMERVAVVRVLLADVDRAIALDARNWSLDRMPAVDRNILRMGCYELLHDPEVPARVAIDEAIELARDFGSNATASFVNGILDRIHRDRAGLERHSAPDLQGPGVDPLDPAP